VVAGLLTETFFDLDCSSVIPECGYQCDKCIREAVSVSGAVPGVSDVSMGRHEGVSGIVVRYHSTVTGIEQLMAALRQLPSFYKGRFAPRVLEDRQGEPAE
jgi:hypothetical protein